MGLCGKPGASEQDACILCIFTEGRRCFQLESFDSGGRGRYFVFGSEGRGYEGRTGQMFVRGNKMI